MSFLFDFCDFQMMADLQKKRKEKEKFVLSYAEDTSKSDQGKPVIVIWRCHVLMNPLFVIDVCHLIRGRCKTWLRPKKWL